MDTQIKMLPKAELHCHLDGSVSLDTIRQLAEMEGIPVPVEEEKLRALTMAPPDCGSLKQYLNCFGLAVSCMQAEDTLRLAAFNLIKEAASEHLIYIEVRFAPLLHLRMGLRARQVVESVLLGLEQGCQRFDVEYGLILCAMRNESMEHAMTVLELAEEYGGRKVVGIDLAGSEAEYPVTLFSDVFREASHLNIPFTIHAGEAAGPESVKHAVEAGASRIGHGIAASRDKGLLRECRDRGITFEFCPSSNMQTKAAAGWNEYPFMEFYESGIHVTVNTDNRRVTGTNMTREFELLRNHYGIGCRDVERLTYYALYGSFAEEAVRKRLIRKVHVENNN